VGAGYLVNPAVFLIDTLFGLYVFALLLRFLFQWTNADFYNPLSQFLIRITHPPLRFLRRFIPAIGRVDTASLALMFGLQLLSLSLVALIAGGRLSLPALSVAAVAALVEMVLNLYFFAVMIRALLSWVAPAGRHPAASLLYSLTEPLLASSRRLLPPVGMVDLSPLLPLIGIQLAKMLILPPLQQLAAWLA
jgi:YggT family protein